ncbi:MAG: choice-of-anchor D domain-containing protein, partial [Sedimentisphaerales bacterium]|nr:choice-of-anchor D domain-containing protein [Sedimentisphaerales bacterium]
MAFRTLRRRRFQSLIPAKKLRLENLESRLLLSYSVAGWIDEDLSDFIKPGYGIPDATYSDPLGWDQADNSQIQDIAVPILDTSGMDYLTIGDGGSGPGGFNQTALAGGVYTLFLDFDGARVYSRSGDFYLGSDYVDIPAYNLSMFGWGGQESQSISYITQFVQEDYAAYNIQVTTTQPASGEYTTLYVGGDNEWFRPGSSVIGVATYDVGNTDASNYGFAFIEELGIYQQYSYGSLLAFSEYIANLITHEAGHTYGANHVSDPTCMMNPYLPLSPRVQSFGSGTIPSSSQTQDTQSLMGANLGYVSSGGDDYGDTRFTATTIVTGNSISGLLERRDDVDTFKFTAGQTGELTVAINTDTYSNLDSYLQIVRTSDGAAIAQNNDLQGTDSGITFNATAGMSYTVLISSNNNASSGSYTLTFDSGPQLPDITVTDSSGSTTDHSVNFGQVSLGNSLNASITITNEGYGDLVISQLTAGGCFSLNQTSQAGNSSDNISLTPGDHLTVTITYEPDGVGADSGAITIVTNDPDESSIIVSLAGQGCNPEPDIVITGDGSLIGTTLNFGAVQRGQEAAETLVIANQGDDMLTITNISLTTPFTIASGFSGSALTIAPGQQCMIVLEVASDIRQTLSGELVISSNAPNESVLTYNLQAQIVGGVLSVTETAQISNDLDIDFGAVYLGDTPTQTVTLGNTGDGNLTISALTIANGFSSNVACTASNSHDDITLTPGQTLTVILSFTPTYATEYSGNLVIASNDPDAEQTIISLTGQAMNGALAVAEADGTEDGLIAAGSVNLADNTVLDVWRLTNHSLSPITVSLSLQDGGEFELVGNNLITIPAGQEVTVSVRLVTEFACSITDRLMLIADDAEQTYQTANLSADAYALLSQGHSYSFTDHDGDNVRVMLMGDAQARLTLGNSNEPDINAIEFIGGESGSLMILTGSGRTQLGTLTGTADLKMLMASKVDVMGDINLDGTIGNAMLGDIFGATVNFAATSRTMLRAGTISQSDVSITGTLGMLFANTLEGGSFQSDSIGRIMLSN